MVVDEDTIDGCQDMVHRLDGAEGDVAQPASMVVEARSGYQRCSNKIARVLLVSPRSSYKVMNSLSRELATFV